MNIALIKNQICENVAVFETLKNATEMLGEMYDTVIECPVSHGINHRYIDGVWYNPQPKKDENGIYLYIKDMCTVTGDKVLDPNGITYEALEGINFQQSPPSELPLFYKELVAE